MSNLESYLTLIDGTFNSFRNSFFANKTLPALLKDSAAMENPIMEWGGVPIRGTWSVQ